MRTSQLPKGTQAYMDRFKAGIDTSMYEMILFMIPRVSLCEVHDDCFLPK